MGVLHHVIGKAKEGYRWIGNNPLKAAAIGGGVALGLGAAAVYGSGGGNLTQLATQGANIIGKASNSLPNMQTAAKIGGQMGVTFSDMFAGGAKFI
tara:strand:+ start:1247 stop:1534 length:288 start_codon:yes stop_codon:yes gene_type:complete